MGNCEEMASVNLICNVEKAYDWKEKGKRIKSIQTTSCKINQGTRQYKYLKPI